MSEKFFEEPLSERLHAAFAGKTVRKDLTKRIREGVSIPVYVLEYLLGMYCSTDDETLIEQGVENVKRILANNYVRPDEAQKVISKIREKGIYTVIDKVSVKLNYKTDVYEASFVNLGIQNIPIPDEYASKFERLLCGGIWCILKIEYSFDQEDKHGVPFVIQDLKPIQMSNLDFEGFKKARASFTESEWIDLLLRSVGLEPTCFEERVKWLHLLRLIPLVENNFNLCELGPRGTGKSHVYKEISPYSILISGGHTTVANLFYNMGKRAVGLVGLWDCVAFDEVAGISFKDNDGVQLMKDYMNSGSFTRGKEPISASASMVFVGNINQGVETILRTSHLFDPFPEAMANDAAFLDRMHCYLPGWEIPKYGTEHFTNGVGLIADYLSEVFRELRKTPQGDVFRRYFKLGRDFKQRDSVAVQKITSGLIKLVYPDGKFGKSEVEKILRLALEMRRRVKEQLKKIGGMEYYDVNFSYIDNETLTEEFVSVPERRGSKIIPEGTSKPGHLFCVAFGKSNMGVFKIETQMTPGTGKLNKTGIGADREAKEALDTAFKYLQANSRNISSGISTTQIDYTMNVQDLNGVGMTKSLTTPALIAICSAALGKPTLSGLAILGDMTIGGTIQKVDELANAFQVCLDSGAKKILLPMTSANDFSSVPSDLLGKFNLIFYQSAIDATFKALGVE